MAAHVKNFTLIELMIVISIIAILASMLLPALNKTRRSALRVSCLNQLKMLGGASFLYSQDYGGFLPPTYGTTWKTLWPIHITSYLGFKEGVIYTTTKEYNHFPAGTAARFIFHPKSKGRIFYCPALSTIPDSVMPRPANQQNSITSYSINFYAAYVNYSAEWSNPDWHKLGSSVFRNSSGIVLFSEEDIRPFTKYASQLDFALHERSVNGFFLDGHAANGIYKRTMSEWKFNYSD